MSKKSKKIIKNVIGIIVFSIATVVLYNMFTSVHANYCCTGITNCSFLVCSQDSPKLTEFVVLAFFLFFCGLGAIIEIFDFIKNIFK